MDTPFSSSWGFPTGNNSTTAQQTLGDSLDQSFSMDPLPGASTALSSLTKTDNRSDFEKVIDSLLGSSDQVDKDLYYNYILNEKSLTDAYNRELEADSTKYQRLVKDLKKAGLNPMFALNGATAGNINSSAGSYSSGYETARHNKASESLQRQSNVMNFVGKLISSAIGIGMLLA